ncbi:hypothetical protein Tcan_10408 [Toxocara canis]|uniref:Uncharacterized protein n=1 Tax=Toxocara canis TaxID=6265 RepID=A0A0B2VMG1_TOXCA|nr:hypothetical protein Tcan_10408 [Toxocara canis]
MNNDNPKVAGRAGHSNNSKVMSSWILGSVVWTAMLLILTDQQTNAFPTMILDDPRPYMPPNLDGLIVPKRRDGGLRNCFFSPVQCLLPFDNKSLRRFGEKRTIGFQ